MISLKSLRHLRKALGVTTTLNWHVEDHETLEQAVRREVKEETNLDFRPDKFVGWLRFFRSIVSMPWRSLTGCFLSGFRACF